MTGPVEKQRFHALDSVRATAMLLGVVYHSMLFRMMVGGGPPGPMGMGGPSRYLQDWLHSFRMPLFFFISGFFGRMMLEKYGTGDILAETVGANRTPIARGYVHSWSCLHIDP